jgi:hypothetical protein
MSPATEADAATVTADTIAGKIDSDVTTALTATDAATTQRVQTLGLVHQARLAQLTRTAAAVAAQYGAGSTQAAAANAAVTAAQGTVARLAVLGQQVSPPQPEVDATGWALHGYVYNDQLQPVSAYCVFLVDEQNTYQSAYGFAYTDATGYFVLNVPGSTAPAKGQTQPAPAAAAAPAPAPKLFVQIANANAQPIYLSSAAFEPTTGAATFQNIALPAGEKPIGNPPRAVRKTALPPAKKSS